MQRERNEQTNEKKIRKEGQKAASWYQPVNGAQSLKFLSQFPLKTRPHTTSTTVRRIETTLSF